MVINAQNQIVGRWSGYTKPLFLERTAATLVDLTPMEEKIARFAKEPTETGASTLARFHESKGEYKDALKYYAEANRLAGTPKSDYLLGAFESSFGGVEEGILTFPDLQASADAVFQFKAVPPGDLLYPARAMVYSARKAEKLDAAIPYLKKAEEATRDATDAEVVDQRKKFLPDYDLIVLKDADRAVADKKASFPEGWMEESGRLNAFAWWCFENTINLEEAETLAQKGVALAPAGSEKAQILDTLAEICNARGDCGEALAIIENAIREDPSADHYKKQRERFATLVAEGKTKN